MDYEKVWTGRGLTWADRFTAHPFRWLFLTIMLLTVIGWGLSAIGLIGGAVNNAGTVMKKEFYPEALLKKYEWFKNAAAELDKKQADISVYDRRLATLTTDYAGTRRAAWPRDDREQYNQWLTESAGVKASYNALAAEYNAQMAKLNWAFTNVGQLPEGGTPLPREFRTYTTE